LPVNPHPQSSLVKAKKSGCLAALAPRSRYLERAAAARTRVAFDRRRTRPRIRHFPGKVASAALDYRRNFATGASVSCATYGFSFANGAGGPHLPPAEADRPKIHLKIVPEDYGAI
jgi:hypothetical protein